MMNRLVLTSMVMTSIWLAGCASDQPMNGRAENAQRTHIQFGNGDLEARTRIQPVQSTRDAAGLVHVTVNIRATTDLQQYVDAFITFTRNGEPVDKQGPQQLTLKANLFDTFTFTSMVPADDYFISLAYAK